MEDEYAIGLLYIVIEKFDWLNIYVNSTFYLVEDSNHLHLEMNV